MKKAIILLFLFPIIENVCSQTTLVDSNNKFAFKIYKSTKQDSSNMFISSLGLHLALSIAFEGSESTTQMELNKLLHLSKISDSNLLYKELLSKVSNLRDSAYRECNKWSNYKVGENLIYLANSLWINDKLQIERDFKQKIENDYFSEVVGFDNSNISTVNNKLNQWVSQKTNKRIQEISGIDPSVQLSIINAIYFMGEWKVPFDKKKTRLRQFYTLEKNKKKMDFMNQQNHYRYFEDMDIQSVILPYACEQISMVILLPKRRYGIQKLEEKIDINYWYSIKQANSFQEVILSLPKFKIETEIYPKEAITQMGYGKMFSDAADFSKISKTDCLKIDNIVHKTFIEIDETKTEATAVSKVDMVIIGFGGRNATPPPSPKIFTADHPFMFLIVDNRTNAILFMGRYVKE